MGSTRYTSNTLKVSASAYSVIIIDMHSITEHTTSVVVNTHKYYIRNPIKNFQKIL